MKKTILKLSLFLLVLPGMLTAQNNAAEMEKNLQDRLALLHTLESDLVRVTTQSDSLAAQINTLKRDNLSYLERSKLENWLAQSQILAGQQQEQIVRLTSVRHDIAARALQLDRHYAVLIDSLVRVAAGKNDLSNPLQHYRARRSELQAYLVIPADPLHATALTATADQMPEEIEARAGLMRDREDKLRQRAGAAQSRIKQIRQEMALRKKMSELLDDVRVFDQRDEAVAVTSRTIGDAAIAGEDTKGYNALPGTHAVDVASPMERLLQQDVRSLPVDEVEFFLVQLESERQRWLTQADSLARIAKEHDRRALELRKNINTPQ